MTTTAKGRKQKKPDTKFLVQKHGVWWFQFRLPADCRLGGRGQLFRHTLGTKDLHHARNLRDRVVVPLMASLRS